MEVRVCTNCISLDWQKVGSFPLEGWPCQTANPGWGEKIGENMHVRRVWYVSILICRPDI
jgi:hypothetical protein